MAFAALIAMDLARAEVLAWWYGRNLTAGRLCDLCIDGDPDAVARMLRRLPPAQVFGGNNEREKKGKQQQQ